MNEILLKAAVPEELNALRLDQALAKLFPQHSRSRLQTWIQAGHVTVDDKCLRAKDKVYTNQEVSISATLEAQTSWVPQSIALDIIYEDGSIIVINKPVGLVVHPAAGNPDKTLVNALLHHVPNLELLPRAGIVHRLDKDTSGLLVVAKTVEAHTQLVAQIQARSVKREYFAIVNGQITSGGTISAPLGRHRTQRTRMAVTNSGKDAITHFRVLKRFSAHTALQVFLETGRTHQIRVHMAHMGHPLVGDPLYGGRLKIPANCSEPLKQILQTFKRQALHAKKLTLLHPGTQVEMSWEADLPEDLHNLMKVLY